MKKLFILTAAAFTFAACSNDSDKATTIQNNDSAIRLTTGMVTRGTNQDIQSTQMANGQSAWVIFTASVTPDNETTTTGEAGKWETTNNTASAAYTADGAGTLSTTSVTKWPKGTAGTETVSIKAFAPFTALPSGDQTVAANQTTDANYLASDYLFGQAAAFGNSAIQNPVLVTFDHMLAKVIVNVTAADASVSVSGAKVVFGDPSSNNVELAYSINTTTGAVSAPASNNAGSIVMADAVAADGKCAAIVVPQTIANAQKLFTITLGTTTYTYTLPAAKTFTGGNVYTYNVSLRTDGTVIILNETINQWTSDTTEGVIAG